MLLIIISSRLAPTKSTSALLESGSESAGTEQGNDVSDGVNVSILQDGEDV